MNPENLNSLPEHTQHMVDEMQKTAENKINKMIEQHDQSSERYVEAVKILERASAGDHHTLEMLNTVLRAEASDEQYEQERKIIDTALYIIKKFGNPYIENRKFSETQLETLSQQAFEALIKEEYGYFQ